MAWIESHQELRDHPKTKRAARNLGIEQAAMIGHLHMLWWWALDYADDGDLAGFDNADIAEGAGWSGDPDAFVSALISAGRDSTHGFLNEDRTLHDWGEYAGKLVARRRANAERKRASRPQPSSDSPPTVRSTSAVRPQDRRETYTGQARDGRGVSVATEQNRTEQNPVLTEQNPKVLAQIEKMPISVKETALALVQSCTKRVSPAGLDDFIAAIGNYPNVDLLAVMDDHADFQHRSGKAVTARTFMDALNRVKDWPKFQRRATTNSSHEARPPASYVNPWTGKPFDGSEENLGMARNPATGEFHYLADARKMAGS